MGKDFSNPTTDKELISNMYKELKKLDINKLNNPLFIMGYISKQRILNRETSNGQEALKEMLDIRSNQGNANENNFEILMWDSPSYAVNMFYCHW